MKYLLTVGVTSEQILDDLVSLDCVAEVLDERIKDTGDMDDELAMRRWLKTIDKLRNAYDDLWTNVK